MATNTGASGHRCYVHEAVAYDSDEQLLNTVVPFLRDGLAEGEPTVVAWSGEHAAQLRSVMPDADRLVFLDEEDCYARPSSTVRVFRELMTRTVADGASRIRIVGELTAVGQRASWPWWARYEAAINRIYDEFPLWGLCCYDTRQVPDHVLDDVRRAHPWIATRDGRHLRNEQYTPPGDLLTGQHVPPDPLEATTPVIDLVNEPLATVRHAVWDAERAGRLPANTDIDALVLVVNEAATNAIWHGELPVRFRLWAGSDRVVTAVSDRGPGPSDPRAGLLPAVGPRGGAEVPGGAAGRGLWVIHELSDFVTFDTGSAGCTLRATLGNIPPIDSPRMLMSC